MMMANILGGRGEGEGAEAERPRILRRRRQLLLKMTNSKREAGYMSTHKMSVCVPGGGFSLCADCTAGVQRTGGGNEK